MAITACPARRTSHAFLPRWRRSGEVPLFFPSPPCGRRSREAPDEGFFPRRHTPHPSQSREARLIHPLPQGERERKQRGGSPMTTTAMLRSFCDAVEQRNGRAFADLFTEDGVYHDVFYGAFAGHEKIAG